MNAKVQQDSNKREKKMTEEEAAVEKSDKVNKIFVSRHLARNAAFIYLAF